MGNDGDSKKGNVYRGMENKIEYYDEENKILFHLWVNYNEENKILFHLWVNYNEEN